MYKLGIEYSKPQEGDFKVINHGDFWINNMMFKHDTLGHPIDHIMVHLIIYAI